MNGGTDLWGDPPLTTDPLELAQWVCEALRDEAPIIAMLRDVASGELGTDVITSLRRAMGEEGGDPLPVQALLDGLNVAGHDRMSADLGRRLGWYPPRGPAIHRERGTR